MDTLLRKITDADFAKIMAEKGYAYFTNGKYNLNIVGVRRKGTEITNRFDDFIVVTYKGDNEVWHKDIFPATTDPGLSACVKPVNKLGCAILVPNQYRSTFKIGYHKGQYEALCQYKEVSVYRDGNKDKKYDFSPKSVEHGIFGINIHKAGSSSTIVDGWSAGCQVFAIAKDFMKFMDLVHKQVSNGMGKLFTYTLLNEEDL